MIKASKYAWYVIKTVGQSLLTGWIKKKTGVDIPGVLVPPPVDEPESTKPAKKAEQE